MTTSFGDVGNSAACLAFLTAASNAMRMVITAGRYPDLGEPTPMQSIAIAMFLEPFKAAAAEGAVVELKMRLLAGSVPALQQHALDWQLKGIETKLVHLAGYDDSFPLEHERRTAYRTTYLKGVQISGEVY